MSRNALFWQLPAAAVLAAALLVMVPSPAHAWQVSVQVVGAGRILETTPARLMDCITPYSSTATTCTAGSPNGPYGSAWFVEYQATARPGYTFLRWESTNGADVICDGATGTTYANPTCSFYTFDNLNVRAVFVDTAKPHPPAILSGPSPLTNQTTANLTFSPGSDPTIARMEGRLDSPGQAGGWATVGIPGSDHSQSYSNLTANGLYRFTLRSVDYAGNVSDTSAWEWVVDTVPPEVPVVTSPADGTHTNATNLVLQGVAGMGAASVEVHQNNVFIGSVIVDAGSWTVSRNDIPEGTYSFTFVARDRAGNASAASPVTTVEVDRSAPLTVVTGPADGSYDLDGTVVLSGTSEPGVEVSVATGSGTVTGETGPDSLWSLTVPDQSDGPHTYAVHGTDGAGNQSDPVERSIIVDTRAPRATAVTPKPGARRVGRAVNVVAQLTETVRAATVRSSTVHLVRQGTSKRLRAKVTYDAARNRVVLNPVGPLAPGKVYVATVGAGVVDIAGHRLARALSWKFRTAG